MILYIIRHGETDWNRIHRVQGRTDIPLNEYGRHLAEETADGMKDLSIDLCYTSPLKRARETAQIILRDRAVPIFDDARIQEMSFGSYEGSFVLYDAGADIWEIYNEKKAGTRVSPDSTYKIFDALMALEEGVITPDSSTLAWDGTECAFDAWNSDQDLTSAIQNSVNWYFQSIDRQAGRDTVADFYDRIGYGNCDTSGDISSYWMESTLKISPVEQVELLTGLYYNEFGFSQKNTDAVKASLKLLSGQSGTLSGKTGTGMVDGKNVNGWFVGYVEQPENVYFFAVNIQGREGAAGSAASDLALSVLRSRGIWEG